MLVVSKHYLCDKCSKTVGKACETWKHRGLDGSYLPDVVAYFPEDWHIVKFRDYCPECAKEKFL